MTPINGRAAVLADYNEPFVTREFPVPTAEPGGIVVKIDVATVCGSDVHVWLGHLKDSTPITPPLILGHEMVGVVESLGEGAEFDSLGGRIEIGDRIVWAHTPCGQCHECTIERQPQLCSHRYIAYLNDCSKPPYFTGSFAEYGYVVPRAGRLRVPDGVESNWAAAGSCSLRTVVKGAEVAGSIDFADSIVIQGAGPLGLFATALLSTHNPRQLIVVGGPDERLALSREWGATHTVSINEYPTAAGRIERVREITGGGADIAFEYAGAPGAVAEGIELVRRNGRYIVMGTLGGAPQSVDVAKIANRGIRVTGSMSGEIGNYQTALEFLDRFSGRFDWNRMFGASYGLDDLAEAMDAMVSMREIKPVIVPSQR